MKRIVSLLLAILLLPIPTAFAVEGACGDGLAWVLDDSGTLTISGTGDMKNFDCANGDHIPWESVFDQIKRVVVRSGVTSVGDEAFMGCSSLTSVELPATVTSIGRDAFANCEALADIAIPDSVTSIGFFAFYGCTALTEITVPDSVTALGIGAFYGCTGLRSVTIGSGVTAVPETCLRGCTALTEVRLPATIAAVEESAFGGCSALTDVYFGGSPMQWGQLVVENDNESLETVTLHAAMVDTGSGTCGENLTWVLDEEGTLTVSGSGAMWEFSMEEHNPAPWYPAWASIKKVVLEDGVTSVGSEAFFGCAVLASVDLPNGVTALGRDAFCGCSALASVNIPLTVKQIGDWCFYDCESLAAIALPEGLQALGEYAFAHCSGLTRLHVPASVTELSDGVLEGCEALTEVSYSGATEQWEQLTQGMGLEVQVQLVRLPGDLDGKSGVNNDDVLYLLWHNLFSNEYPLTVSGDMDGKDGVNNDDVLYLLWHILFPSDYPIHGNE